VRGIRARSSPRSGSGIHSSSSSLSSLRPGRGEDAIVVHYLALSTGRASVLSSATSIRPPSPGALHAHVRTLVRGGHVLNVTLPMRWRGSGAAQR
jgi:hypothetical protein